jgi:8-oxo-dGTP pyrophosphatase MutT (NUDIX family)
MGVQPRLAATVMLLRDSDKRSGQVGQRSLEVFMVRRVVQSEFMPDVYVFPGGSVSADDLSTEQSDNLCMPVDPGETDPEGRTALGRGVRAAAIRELFEEANVLLAYREQHMLSVSPAEVERFARYRREFNARRGTLAALLHAEWLTLATNGLYYFAHWITPVGMPKRYDTHFFLAVAPVEQEPLYDNLETSEGVWIRPAEALARFEQKTFPITFPTFHQLSALAASTSVEEALRYARTHYVQTRLPVTTQIEGVLYVHLPEDPAHPWRI